jgi:hypothetical protein
MLSSEKLPAEIKTQIWGLAFAEVEINCPHGFLSYQYSTVVAWIRKKLREAQLRGRRIKLLSKDTWALTHNFGRPLPVLIFKDWPTSFRLPQFFFNNGWNEVGVQINHTYIWKRKGFGADGNELSPWQDRATEKSQEDCYSLMAKRANVEMLWSQMLRDPKDGGRMGLRVRYQTSQRTWNMDRFA